MMSFYRNNVMIPSRGLSLSKQTGRLSACWVLSALAGAVVHADTPAQKSISYSHQVRPILSDKCFKCHGPDAENNESEFRVDTFENATADLGGYAGIVPGNPKASRLIQTIHSKDPEDVMPPPEAKMTLSEEQKAILEQWIKEGAKYEKHWGFTTLPKEVTVPSSKHPTPQNEIDHFIHQGLSTHNFTSAKAASKEHWLRRVTFDLTGLPPSLTEIDAFLADTSPQAYEKQVERLLSLESYGERMATEWMDVARYADSYGYQIDRGRMVWQWRDWVVRSFNQNLRYNDFILHQLAGDLIPDATQQTQLATTFNRLHGQKNEGGSIPEEFRQAYIADRVNTVGTAFLGLTMDCTKCHDHKYDPLTQKDYFSMAAFFSNIDEAGLYPFMQPSVPPPSLALSTPTQEHQLTNRQARITQLEQERAALPEAFTSQPLEPLSTLDFSKEKDGSRLLNGDHSVNLDFPPENSNREVPVSFNIHLQLPEEYERAHLFGTSRATLDSAYRGLSMMMENGQLAVKLAHMYPGDALEIITTEKLPINQWIKLALTYDGSSRAEGLKLYLNGKPLQTITRYDRLTNTTYTTKKHTIARIGAIARDKGLKNTRLKDAQIYLSTLSPVQVADLHAGKPLFQSSPQILAKEKELRAARKLHNDLQNKITRIMAMRESDRKDQPYVKTYILNRGNYNEPTEEVQPATPSVLPDFGLADKAKATRLNRLDFAHWLIHPEHPLTARVTVNRYWQMFFGHGLVKTSEDFGHQAAIPAYPELLDWLARDFINSGWDLHHLIKKITLSHAYRQASRPTAEVMEKDPENEYLSHFASLPLTAEMLRDNALAQSGLLNPHLGGAPQTPYDLMEAFKPQGGARNKGPHQYRRSLYTHWQINGPSPLMLTLDSAKRDVCSVKREKTATPLRSLVLLNSTQFVEAARACADSLLKKDQNATTHPVTAFRMLTSRPPSEAEIKILNALYQEQLDYFSSAREEATELLNVGHYEEQSSVPPEKLAALTNTILTLLNHDEAQMKY
ncbi:MAG: DUF1553 domain-containing protein [Akkermansiaceae bacterium]